MKDSTKVNGIGEISGNTSRLSVKFKNDTLKYKTYRSKEIIGIDILEINSNGASSIRIKNNKFDNSRNLSSSN